MAAALRAGWPGRGYDDDLAPQLISWTIAAAAGAAWLGLVYLSPTRVSPFTAEPRAGGPVIEVGEGWAPPTPRRVGAGAAEQGAGGSRSSHETQSPSQRGSLTEAFATATVGHLTADVAALIGTVQELRGGGESAGAPRSTNDKASLATGMVGATPGIASFGGKGTLGGPRVGEVSQGGAINRAEVRVRPLPIVAAPAVGGARVDPTEVGTFVRSRAAQLQTCYVRAAGGDAALAGVVTMRLELGVAGVVQRAQVVRSTWSGPEAAAVEACLLATVRAWRLPSGEEGATLTLPISFTR